VSGDGAVPVRFACYRTRAGRRHELRAGIGPATKEPGAVPRVARLLALAHHWQGLLDRGAVRNLAAIARLTGATRARVTQIMDLLLLAPAIQEAILEIARATRGRDLVVERDFRPVAALASWDEQFGMWGVLRARSATQHRLRGRRSPSALAMEN
jgi:hypothetical protein